MKVSVGLITEGISPSGHSGANLIISRFGTSVMWPIVDWTKKDTWLKQKYEKQFAKASEGPFFVNCLIQKEAARCRGRGRAQPLWAFRQAWVPRTSPWLCFKRRTHRHHIYWMQFTAKNPQVHTEPSEKPANLGHDSLVARKKVMSCWEKKKKCFCSKIVRLSFVFPESWGSC